MTIGLVNETNVTIDQLIQLTNFTSTSQFFVNVNEIVYDGILFFVMLLVLWIIMFLKAQHVKNEPLANITMSGAIVTVIAFFGRTIVATIEGNPVFLVNDFQMWIFPIVTALFATILYATKKR